MVTSNTTAWEKGQDISNIYIFFLRSSPTAGNLTCMHVIRQKRWSASIHGYSYPKEVKSVTVRFGRLTNGLVN